MNLFTRQNQVLIITILLALLSLFILGYLIILQQSQAAELIQAIQRLQQLQQQDFSSQQQHKLQQAIQADYQQLQHAGLIGQQPRLEWLTALKQLEQQLKPAALNYAITPAQLLNLPLLMQQQAVKLQYSSLQVRAELLHEGDALVLLRALSDSINGLQFIRSCRWLNHYQPPATVRYTPETAYLELDCAIDWYTVIHAE